MFVDLNTVNINVMESGSGILSKETVKPKQGNDCLLKLTSPPELIHYLRVTGVCHCYHISCISSKLVWVSDDHSFILTNTTGVIQYRVKDLCRDLYYSGSYTVNSESELIYI